MGRGATSVTRQVGWGSRAASVPIEARDEDICGKAGVGVQALAALSRCGETTRSGAIPADPAGMALDR